jgi:MFS family permease
VVDRDVVSIPHRVWRFVLLLGVVSLFADMTYEGARSISGPFLAVLGANATAVGFIVGFGELIGYGLRLVSGYVADRSGRYWLLVLGGYSLNLLAVPLLALVGHWQMAAVLLIAERLGKAIRAPARDVILSHATAQLGHGKGFAVHEALDQIGAVTGPLMVAAVLYAGRGYAVSFSILLLPALLALGTLVVARWLYPHPRALETTAELPATPVRFPRAFWFYLAAVVCFAGSYADFPLIAYHVKTQALLSEGQIAVLYALAMGVDAVAALIMGPLFDRYGLRTLIPLPLLTALIAPLAFAMHQRLIVVGVVVWGVGMGAQESVMRAAIATLVPIQRRGTAYGLFNAVYGLSWFVGSAVLGGLYDLSILALMLFAVALALAGFPLLWQASRQSLEV